jgi:WD40 repeat protein
VRAVHDGAAADEMLHVPSAEAKMIMQSRWSSFDGSTLLVLATAGGVQIWDKDGKYMVFVFAFDAAHVTMPQGPAAHDIFARGIASTDGPEAQVLCVGTSMGEIIVFDRASGDKFSLSTVLRKHAAAICCLDADGVCLASADDEGAICTWDLGRMKLVATMAACGSPCTSLILGNDDTFGRDLILAGFASGHIRLFSRSAQSMVCELAAHARAVMSVACAPEHPGMFASAGEDTCIHLWQLTNSEGAGEGKGGGGDSVATGESLSVRLMDTMTVGNGVVTGIQFVAGDSPANPSIVVASYDVDKLSVFEVR